MVLLLAAVTAAGCASFEAQQKYERMQRYAHAHPAMEQCILNASPKGETLLECMGKSERTEAQECFRARIGQFTPREKEKITSCVLQAQEGDRDLLSAMAIRSAGAPRVYYSAPRYYVNPAPAALEAPRAPASTNTTCMPVGFSVNCTSTSY